MNTTVTETTSTITAVTVYQGRAMITRTATTALEPGRHRVIFPDLPSSLDRDTIQVKGTGEATLGECVFETQYFVEDVDETRRQMHKKAQEMEDQIAQIQLNIEACGNEKTFIEKIAGVVTSPANRSDGDEATSKAMSGNILDAEVWKNMFAFYHDQTESIDNRRLASQRAERDLQKALETIYDEIDSLGNRTERSRNIITVSLEKKSAGKITLDLSYVINGPTWWPVYNIRAESNSNTILLEYDAVVKQSTGEAWQDVSLKLSTARVNVSGVMPVLYPWRLDFEQVFYAREISKKKSHAYEEEKVEEDIIEAPCSIGEDLEEMNYIEASVETGGTSVVFNVTGGGNIDGDNTDTRVSVLRRKFPASAHYATVPKLSGFAYLTATITNNSDFPLLPGKSNIFFEDAFVSSSSLPLVMPGQEMEISLGIDDGISVEYRFLKRFKKIQGIVSKRVSEQFDYQIRIVNNLKKEISIDVFDQIPITQDKEITVKAIQPVFKGDKAEALLDDESRIQWKLLLAPEKKQELHLSFTVEYPSGRQLNGL